MVEVQEGPSWEGIKCRLVSSHQSTGPCGSSEQGGPQLRLAAHQQRPPKKTTLQRQQVSSPHLEIWLINGRD